MSGEQNVLILLEAIKNQESQPDTSPESKSASLPQNL